MPAPRSALEAKEAPEARTAGMGGPHALAGDRSTIRRTRDKFAADSPLEEAVSSEPVSEAEIPC